MKKLLVIGLMALTCCGTQTGGKRAAVIEREKGSITFVVDEDLPAPTGFRQYEIRNGAAVKQLLLRDHTSAAPQIVAASFDDEEELRYLEEDAFYRTMVEAYAGHRPLVLSPDMVWMSISQGFASYVNAHSEEVRHLLVDHEGKIDLVVETTRDPMSGSLNWEALVDSFSTAIMQNTKGELAEALVKDFSTTGPVEHVASRITLMKAVESYFGYIAMDIICGIPHIKLEGTPEDWQQVLAKTKLLEPFGLKAWTDRLTPILEQFIKAAKGKPEKIFWQSIVRQMRVDELRGNGCVNVGEWTDLDGWFLAFFPDKEGNTKTSVKHTESMPSELVHVGFKFVQVGGLNGQTVTPMELTAGFVGAEVDEKTKTMRPKLGWMVSLADSDDEQLEKMQQQANHLWLSISEVPEVLSRVQGIKNLTLDFAGEVALPAWMDTMTIQQLTVRGRMTDEQKEELKRRFPKIKLQNQK